MLKTRECLLDLASIWQAAFPSRGDHGRSNTERSQEIAQYHIPSGVGIARNDNRTLSGKSLVALFRHSGRRTLPIQPFQQKSDASADKKDLFESVVSWTGDGLPAAEPIAVLLDPVVSSSSA